jgi:4-hydroxythreonine-4-phosphate dehydrogenase
MGDPNGIGPEVILKTLKEESTFNAIPVIAGNPDVIRFYAESISDLPDFVEITTVENATANNIYLLPAGDKIKPEPGKITPEAGRASMKAIEAGTVACMKGTADALVTAPISKEAISLAGYTVPGHTEFLSDLTSTDEVLMMLVNDSLRVGLVTIHIPVADITGILNQELVLSRIRLMAQSLKNDFNIAEPHIAVLGLNPHAGDGGVIGKEEITIIKPALEMALNEGLNVEGPFPADGFFGSRQWLHFDAVLAMYHDQGLVPFKTIAFGGGVNFTAGLPIIRTSPDHGTAFAIAGKNRAKPDSFMQAYRLAVRMAKNRIQQHG